MEAFAMLKKAANYGKTLVNFSQLPAGEYVVSEFSLVQTRFGVQIKADLGDKCVFLPKRFAKDMNDERVAALNTLPHILIYHGMDNSGACSM